MADWQGCLNQSTKYWSPMRFSINLSLIFYQYLRRTVRIRFTDWGIARVTPDGIGGGKR
jgi:hypothetical protein